MKRHGVERQIDEKPARMALVTAFVLIVACLACYALVTLDFSSPRYRWLGSATRSVLIRAAESMQSVFYRDYIWK